MTFPINIFTTFSKGGYALYGKRWLESNLTNWPNAKITIYTDFDLEINHANVNVINFDDVFPYHKEWQKAVKEYFNRFPEKGRVIGNKTVKFSYKGFCIYRETQLNRKGMTIWTDADTQTLKPVKIDFQKLLENKFLACQVEKAQNNNPHIESGILFFNSNNPDTKNFGNMLEDFYNSDKLYTIKKPYDGYIIAKILKSNNMNFVDLNQNYNVLNKRSSKEETFLHPILKENFVHWIGQFKT